MSVGRHNQTVRLDCLLLPKFSPIARQWQLVDDFEQVIELGSELIDGIRKPDVMRSRVQSGLNVAGRLFDGLVRFRLDRFRGKGKCRIWAEVGNRFRRDT